MNDRTPTASETMGTSEAAAQPAVVPHGAVRWIRLVAVGLGIYALAVAAIGIY
jgi:hypothetical protein